jgi:hypothetical protein
MEDTVIYNEFISRYWVLPKKDLLMNERRKKTIKSLN